MSEVEGFGNTLRAMGASRKKDGERIEDGLKACGEIILKKSNYYVPKDTRFLEGSGRVVVEGKGMGASVSVRYTARYAVHVHEDLEARHAEPTCAKYLQRGTRETRGACKSRLGREMVGKDTKV